MRTYPPFAPTTVVHLPSTGIKLPRSNLDHWASCELVKALGGTFRGLFSGPRNDTRAMQGDFKSNGLTVLGAYFTVDKGFALSH